MIGVTRIAQYDHVTWTHVAPPANRRHALSGYEIREHRRILYDDSSNEELNESGHFVNAIGAH